MLFMAYVSVRGTLWVRGRMNVWKLDHTLPRPEPRRGAPEHVGADAVSLFRASNEARAIMTRHHRVIARSLIADPDAPLGVIRSAKYRRAVRQGASDLHRYLRTLEAAPPNVRSRLERSGADPERLRRLAAGLHSTAVQVSRTRDYEPFPVEQVRSVSECYAAITRELASIERAIEAPSGHPYRATASAFA